MAPNSSPVTSSPLKHYAGKRFAIGFLLVIAAFLVASVLINRRFEAVTARFEVLRQEWARVADALEVRFAGIDAAVAGGESGAAAKYKRLRVAYLKSSLYDEQSRLLAELWESCKAWRELEASRASAGGGDATNAPPTAPLDADARQRLERFIAADREVETLLKSPVGRLTQTILLLDYPPRVYQTLRDIFG